MTAHYLGDADDLPIPAHHRPETNEIITTHGLCETTTDIVHGFVQHAVTIAWARRPQAWSALDLGQFHQTAQHFAYADLFHDALRIGALERIEDLAAQVQAGLDHNDLLAGRPAYSRWTAVLGSDDEIVTITIATGDSADSTDAHLRNVWQHTGTVVDVNAPVLHAAFAWLLAYRNGADRDRPAAAAPQRRERPASAHRRWTAVLDADDQLVSIAVAAGGTEEEHFADVWTHNGRVIEFDADELDFYSAFTELLAEIEKDDEGFTRRFAAEQARRTAAHAARAAVGEGR
ncbi:hypothetical protein ACFV4P_03125 [Kitasatospora sp. NPDC059795]|uniref:hypothetical protein n=1 Tax=Kitasatospora sp. NPDC059795 TaxID=3346949 RepID=UPI00364FF115